MFYRFFSSCNNRYLRQKVLILLFIAVIILLIYIRKLKYDIRSGIERTDIRINSSIIPLILRWEPLSGEEERRVKCGENLCDVTNNRSRKGEQTIMMYSFYGSHFKPYDLPVPRGKGDIWGLIHEESPKNSNYLFSNIEILQLFNLTATFKRQSSYPLPTFGLRDVDSILDTKYLLPLEEKNLYRKLGLAPVVYIQSGCDAPSDRDQLVLLLQKYIPIDSYGKCINNKKLPPSLSFEKVGSMSPMESDEFYKFLSRYKFALAFENAVCDDYVTEKFWRPIQLGVVPVVFGSPTIQDFLPDGNSAVVATDYESVEKLAEKLLELDGDDEAYNTYIKYKTTGITNPTLHNFINLREWGQGREHINMFSGYTCFLCHKLYDILRKPDILYQDVTIDDYGCPAPKRFDAYGVNKVVETWWQEEWYFSRFLAKAARYFYDKGIRTTESRLRSFASELFMKTGNT